MLIIKNIKHNKKEVKIKFLPPLIDVYFFVKNCRDAMNRVCIQKSKIQTF
ncbi:hypothetical protein FDUTEX481_05133 [Tolypothrix sp. PCC 7601]|nr:hypothetical protein FDUTEX481_05133 [Tolypothrix sp. PCC 7601]